MCTTTESINISDGRRIMNNTRKICCEGYGADTCMDCLDGGVILGAPFF